MLVPFAFVKRKKAEKSTSNNVLSTTSITIENGSMKVRVLPSQLPSSDEARRQILFLKENTRINVDNRREPIGDVRVGCE